MDLLIAPSTRDVTDVAHVIHAVASRSKDKAAAFVKEAYTEAGVPVDDKIALYGSYDELFADKDVDCVYVGTPHSHHYQHVLSALTAGKNVLCEKSLVVNGKQAQALVDLAREKNLFFMEAVWTRFQPVSYKVQEIIRSGILGELRGVQAELNVDWQEAKKDPSHRMTSPKLAGGALLDLGPYPWTWLALTLLPPSKASNSVIPVPSIAASITKAASGVDASTIAAIKFPQEDGRFVHGTLTTGLTSQTAQKRVVLVQGSKGFLEIQWATYRPESISYSAYASEEDFADEKEPVKSETIEYKTRPGGIWGFAWEADEVARCIRDGKKESDRMPLRETVLMMSVFDEIRRQGDLVYPEDIETLEKRQLD